MIGIDTNVLIRYLTQDDPAQAAKATKYLEANCSKEKPGYINHIVLCEIVWVLSHGYKYPKTVITQTIKQLFNTSELSIKAPDEAWSALRDFEQGKADYSDYLIAHKNRQAGYSETITFDKKASQHKFFKLIKT